MTEDERERPTDPIGAEPPQSAEAPIPLQAIPPQPRVRMTAEDLRRHPRYDDNDFGCVSALVIVEGQEEVKRAAEAMSEFESGLDRRFKAQTEAIGNTISANYGLVRSEVVALRTEHETFRAELESLKNQIAALEPLKQRLTELEALFAKSEESDAAAEATAPAPR